MEAMNTSRTFRWEAKENKFILFQGSEVVLELVEETTTKASFTFENKPYVIRNEGFWNPKTVISQDRHNTLVLSRHFFATNAKVEFANANTYYCEIKNTPLVTLSFVTRDKAEILNYKLDTKVNPDAVKSAMTVFPNTIPPNELVMLAVLGFYSFRGIAIENDSLDFIIMTAGT